MHLIALEKEPTSQRGGQELNLFEICRDLSQKGYSVSLLYMNEGDLLDHYRSFCAHVIKVDAFGFDRRRIDHIIKFTASVAKINRLPITSSSVLLINDYRLSLFAYVISLVKNLPFLCYLQIPPSDPSRQVRLALKGVDRFVAVSQKTKREWVNFGFADDLIEVIHNGTDTEKFKPAQDFSATRKAWGFSETAKVICYVGRLDREKGLEYLLKAVALLAEREPEIKLIIAGKPVVHYSVVKGTECEEEGMKYQQSLEQLTRDLSIADRVQFLGHLSNPVSLYQVSDISVLPSIWSEAFGRSIIESLACGTPVIASRVGGIPEILTEEFAENLVTAGDEKALANRIYEVVQWRNTDIGLGDRCRRHIMNKFSLESMMDRVEKTLLKAEARGRV
jgi:glycosyltransferase involved in cell wall biosynthesis